jgi:hypothetical protein
MKNRRFYLGYFSNVAYDSTNRKATYLYLCVAKC